MEDATNYDKYLTLTHIVRELINKKMAQSNPM